MAQARRLPVYRSPGYRGVHKIPPTNPAQPLTPIDLGAGGRLPQVLVDDAGTAHIVWTEDGAGVGPDVTRYCRLKRGSKTCDNPPVTQRLVPNQPGEPRFNNEYHPRILAIGNDVAIISYRYPNVTTKPDGSASSNSTYMWLSTDGGNTFGDPVLVGDQQPSGDAVVFGSPDNPRIGLISDTETGGTFLQALAPGTYTGAKANLDEGDGNRAYGGTLAPVGGGLVAAFTDANANAYVRSWDGAGDPNDPGSWTPSPAPFPGSEPRLASGPSGTFLLARNGLLGSAALQVRQLSGTQAGSPTAVSDTTDAGSHALFEDPAGRLFASWVSSQRPDIRLRTSTNVGRWDADQLLAAGGHSLDQVDLAATFDGGGFATFVRDGQGAFGNGTVQAVPLGNQGATGRLGLGSLPGGSADPSVFEACQRIQFGVVSVTTQQGCFLTAVKGAGIRVSQGPIRINGVDVIPDPGTRILINARARTIDTVGPVSVQLKPIGDSSVEVFHGELHTKVGPGGAIASAADNQNAHGTILASFDTKTFPVGLKGFPVQGKIAIELVPGGTRIPVSLKLPNVFGGVTGQAELRTSEKDGLQLSSLHIEADTIPIGPIFIQDLLIDYQGGSEDTWTGGATLVLPPPGLGAKIGAEVSFKAGSFHQGNIRLGPPYPGISIAPATFLTEIDGGFGVDPLTILVGAHLGAIPTPPNKFTIGVTGTVKVSFGNPVTYEEDGTGDIEGLKLENGSLTANTDGYVHLSGEAKIDLDVLNASGKVDAFVDGQKKQFGGKLKGSICIGGVCSAGGEAVVSSRGIGACITEIVSYGFGYHWGDPLTKVNLMFGSCDLTQYTIPAPGQARSAQAGQFTVRGGTPVESLRLTGAGGAPDVTLVSPQGQRITPVALGPGASSADAVSLAVPSQNLTYIALRHPAAGKWSLEANDGSPPIAQLGLATAQPKPTVRAKVTGRGHTRTLSYRLSGGTGLSATFIEVGREGSKLIGRSQGSHGKLRFAPAYGPGGRRTIVALIDRNGMPRAQVTVASFVAPPAPRPGRVRGLRITRRRSALQLSWRAAPGVSRYLIRVTLSDGRHLARLLRSSVRSLKVSGVSKTVRASVAIRGFDAHGHGGPVSRLRG